MTTATQNQNWAPIGNPEGKNLNPWQKLRPAKLAQIPPRDAPASTPVGNLAEQTTLTKAGTLAVATYGPRWVSPYAAVITNVRATVNTAPTGAAIIVDVLKNGSTIFTTTANRPTIAVSTFTALGTPDNAIIAAGDYFQIQIVQVGSTVAGADLTVELTYQVSGTVTATFLGLTGATGATGAAGSGNMATDSLWDAKGDLAGGTGADTASKLTVGANGTVLVADSSQTTGLKWRVQSYAAVYLAGALTATNGAFVKITYDTTVSQSSDTPFDITTNHNFTAPAAGVVNVTATQQIASVAYSELVLSVYKNGSELMRGPQIALTIKAIWGAWAIPVAASDTLDIRVFQSSAGNQALGTGSLGAHAEFRWTPA